MASDVSDSPTTSARSRLVVAALCVVAVAGCASSQTAPQQTQTNPGAGGVAIVNNQSIGDLITSIQRSGLPVPNPRNVTASDCPAIGCVNKVDTDTLSIMKFPTTGRAELYAGSAPHSFQITDVVITFAPTVTPSQQQQYEQLVTRDIQ